MSSFLCFLCHSTVNSDTNEETREKYREVVGMQLCPDSQLCYICCHVLNKLWLFKSICLKRSLEYPVLFREKGTINLQKSDIETHTMCPYEKVCIESPNVYHFTHSYNEQYNKYAGSYVELEDERKVIEDYLKECPGFTDEACQVYPSELPDFSEDLRQYPSYTDNSKVQYTPKHQENDTLWTDFYLNDNCNEDKVKLFDSSLKSSKGSDENSHDSEDKGLDENYSFDGMDNLDERQEDTTETPKVKTKHKSKRTKKNFKKIFLTLEEQKAELQRNRKSKNYLESEYRCYSCAVGFLLKDSYQTHMMRHEESNGEHKCPLCSLRFASARVLRSHRTSHAMRAHCTRCARTLSYQAIYKHKCEGYDSANCHLCGSLFRDSNGLQQHLKRVHKTKSGNRTYSCTVCAKTYNDQNTLRAHMIKHTSRKFSCPHCDASFSSPYTRNQHRKRHEVNVSETHCCSDCGVVYETRKSLLAHYRNSAAHQQTSYSCIICSRVCPTGRALATHTARAHGHAVHACATCARAYTSRSSLLRHERSHENRSTQVKLCHKCATPFKDNNKLKRHLREVCDKKKLKEQLEPVY